MNPLKWKLHWQIFAAILLAAILAGIVRITGIQESTFVEYLTDTCAFLGKLFMNALKMVVVPLIASSIITGIMNLGGEHSAGRMGLKTMVYYASTGFVAIMVGLLVINLIQPGNMEKSLAVGITEKAFQSSDAEALKQKVEGKGMQEIVDVFERMIPQNVFDYATDNTRLLGIIFFCLFFGFFISKLPEKQRELQKTFWEGISGIMAAITDFVIKFAPIGVLGLVTPIFISTGAEIAGPIALFFVTVILSLLIHMLGTLSLLLYFVGGISPVKHLKSMTSVLLTAFSTASSASTLPITMKTVEKSGVSNKNCSFTLPLGATVNMDGTALYECVVVIFIAQIVGVTQGISFGFTDQLLVVILALTTSIGVAGIPHASLIAISVIMAAVQLPVDLVAIVLVVDRLLDMCRTAVNVYSDTVGAVIIGKSEGDPVYLEQAE